MIEGVSRERRRRALASLVGYVGDFDLAEESTQKAFAITLRLPATTATISRRVFPVAQVPTGVERPLPAPTSRPTAGPPRTRSHNNRPPPRPGHRRRDRAMRRPPPSPVNRPPFAIASGTLAVELAHPRCARIGRLERRARRARHREAAPGPEIRALRVFCPRCRDARAQRQAGLAVGSRRSLRHGLVFGAWLASESGRSTLRRARYCSPCAGSFDHRSVASFGRGRSRLRSGSAAGAAAAILLTRPVLCALEGRRLGDGAGHGELDIAVLIGVWEVRDAVRAHAVRE